MSAVHPFTLLGSRATVDAALRGVESSRGQARALIEGMAGLARQDAALSLRLAMVLAWVKRHDVSALGYSSFTAFCRERVGWADSWLRDLVRLVESPLDLVKAAACAEIVPLRVAVKAPGRVAPEDQATWLLDPVVEVAEPRPLRRYEGADAEVIARARRVARLCLGRAASERQVDDYIVQCWRDRVPAEAILAAARERPAKPEFEALSWDWCAGSSPAEALLGPWVEPGTLAEAVDRIEQIEAVRRGRAAVLARVWAVGHYHALWLDAGFDSPWDFAREVLGWSQRTAQRNRRLGWALEWYPELDRAVADGLDLGAVALLADVVGPRTVDRWVAVAERVGRVELGRAAAASRHDAGVLGRYEAAIEVAERVSGGEPAGAPSAGGLITAPSAGGPVRVALPHDESGPVAGETRGPSELAVAARWFVEHVRVEPQRGFGKVKERDGYRCQNPECGRVSLRNEAHHIHPRSLGGSDDLDNGVTVCRPCHLRGLHADAGGLAVERVVVAGAPALLWRYAGGRSVLALRAA